MEEICLFSSSFPTVSQRYGNVCDLMWMWISLFLAVLPEEIEIEVMTDTPFFCCEKQEMSIHLCL